MGRPCAHRLQQVGHLDGKFPCSHGIEKSENENCQHIGTRWFLRFLFVVDFSIQSRQWNLI